VFDELVVSGKDRRKTHTRWTIAVSLIGQVGILAVLILIPLIYTQALPTAMLTTLLVAPPPPPPPPPPAPKTVVVKPPPSFIQHNQMVAPKVIPKSITVVKDQQTPNMENSGIYGGVAGGSAGALGGILGNSGPAAPPPPPKPKVPQIIHVGGNVQAAKLVSQPMPQYPAIAKAARIQGTVVLHAIIAKDGSIEQLQLISGPPLLVQAALNAVRQWRYQPTLLNGQPVEVDTVIRVVFTLGG